MRSVFVCAALTALTAAVPTAAVAAENGSVLMFVRDGSRDLELMLTEEVGVMRSMLADAGYRVDVATSDGKARSAGLGDADTNSSAGRRGPFQVRRRCTAVHGSGRRQPDAGRRQHAHPEGR